MKRKVTNYKYNKVKYELVVKAENSSLATHTGQRLLTWVTAVYRTTRYCEASRTLPNPVGFVDWLDGRDASLFDEPWGRPVPSSGCFSSYMTMMMSKSRAYNLLQYRLTALKPTSLLRLYRKHTLYTDKLRRYRLGVDLRRQFSPNMK